MFHAGSPAYSDPRMTDFPARLPYLRKQLTNPKLHMTRRDDAEKEEADRVAANIAKLLSEQSFSFTALEFLNIHRHLFEGVFKHAGEVPPMTSAKRNGCYRAIALCMGVQLTS